MTGTSQAENPAGVAHRPWATVAVPGTRGPLRVLSVERLDGADRSLVVARGDFRPVAQALCDRYTLLTRPGGLLPTAFGIAPGFFRIVLDGPPAAADARACELGLALAHVLALRGGVPGETGHGETVLCWGALDENLALVDPPRSGVSEATIPPGWLRLLAGAGEDAASAIALAPAALAAMPPGRLNAALRRIPVRTLADAVQALSSCAGGAAAPKDATVFLCIPTTGSLVAIEALERRPGEAASVLARGDFVPLEPLGEEYRAFIASEGIGGRAAAAASMEPGADWRLTLSGPLGPGRSWTVPVLLAHLLRSKGACPSPVEEARVLVFATGAVAENGGIEQQDYRLSRKWAQALPAFGAARPDARVLALLPPDPSAHEVATRIADDMAGRDCRIVHLSSVADLAAEAHLLSRQGEGAAPARRDGRKAWMETARRTARAAAVPSLAGLALGAAMWLNGRHETGRADTPPLPPPYGLAAFALHPPAGTACLAAAFDGLAFQEAPVKDWSVRADAELCGLRFSGQGAGVAAIGVPTGFPSAFEPQAPTPSDGAAERTLVFRGPPGAGVHLLTLRDGTGRLLLEKRLTLSP